jgi:hypothetical protein
MPAFLLRFGARFYTWGYGNRGFASSLGFADAIFEEELY